MGKTLEPTDASAVRSTARRLLPQLPHEDLHHPSPLCASAGCVLLLVTAFTDLPLTDNWLHAIVTEVRLRRQVKFKYIIVCIFTPVNHVFLIFFIQDSPASLGAGFGSALADIIHLRIPAHPRGAYIRWGIDTRH